MLEFNHIASNDLNIK